MLPRISATHLAAQGGEARQMLPGKSPMIVPGLKNLNNVSLFDFMLPTDVEVIQRMFFGGTPLLGAGASKLLVDGRLVGPGSGDMTFDSDNNKAGALKIATSNDNLSTRTTKVAEAKLAKVAGVTNVLGTVLAKASPMALGPAGVDPGIVDAVSNLVPPNEAKIDE